MEHVWVYVAERPGEFPERVVSVYEQLERALSWARFAEGVSPVQVVPGLVWEGTRPGRVVTITRTSVLRGNGSVSSREE